MVVILDTAAAFHMSYHDGKAELMQCMENVRIFYGFESMTNYISITKYITISFSLIMFTQLIKTVNIFI